jgi:cytochrome c553
MWSRRFVIALFASSVIGAQPTPQQVEFFEKKIRPVLAEKCYGCHNAKLKTPMGGLRLDSRDALLKGGDSGPAIVAGDPAHSRLIAAISYKEDLKMPPTGKLSDEQQADFSAWVRMGAPDPRTSSTALAAEKKGYDFTAGRKFWAFRPLSHVTPPGAAGNPIDAFVLDKLDVQGLKPAPPADKRALLRRVTYDLIGLPPTPEELADFISDKTPNAYQKVVDRLLASPKYGERWGRHWLDLVRYAETNGHEFDDDKLDAWRYRDYVIRAFNQDLPYDQFIREHIAGDLLPNKRLNSDSSALESPVGTSFYWFGEVLNSATDSVKSRADEVDNQVDVVSKAFQGLTVACARCHDHKFDPIPTADYYALAGVMHSTEVQESVIDSPVRREQIEAVRQQIAPPLASPVSPSQFADWRVSGAAFRNAPQQGIANSAESGSDKFVGSLTSPKFRMPKLWVHVRIGGTKSDAKLKENAPLRFTMVADGYKGMHLASDGDETPHWKSMRMTLAIGRMCYFEIVDRSPDGHIVVDKIVFSDSKEPPADEAPAIARPQLLESEIPPSAFATVASDWESHNVRIHIRGNHKNLGEEVPRRFLQIVAGENQKPITSGSGRLEMANAIANPENPLTARVMVNRIWQHHFGYGIVRSVDNFGKMGDRPTHPELLDFLASEFIKSGWSIKAMHRMILLSATYQMSSKVDAAAAKVDPENKLLHHMPVRRLEAEGVRDSILAVSGTLDPTMYGPSVPPHISSYQDGRGKPAAGPLDGNGRRSIYIQVRRNFLTPMFLAFDYPLPISTIGTRGTSTVPSQALIMMNNEFVTAQAAKWAELGGGLTRMYEQAFSRPPDAKESAEITEFLKDHSWTDLAHVLLNSPEFLYLQ